MRKSRFRQEQFVKILKLHENGLKITDNLKPKKFIGEKELDIIALKAALSKKY